MRTLAALLLSATVAFGFTVTNSNVYDVGNVPQSGWIKFLPESAPLFSGSDFVMDLPSRAYMSNGVFSKTLAGGFYNVDFGQGTRIEILGLVGDTNSYSLKTLAQYAANARMFVTNDLPLLATQAQLNTASNSLYSAIGSGIWPTNGVTAAQATNITRQVNAADGVITSTTPLQGTNLVAGTVNSNKLDAATRAMLGAGGSGGVTNGSVGASAFDATVPGYIATNGNMVLNYGRFGAMGVFLATNNWQPPRTGFGGGAPFTVMFVGDSLNANKVADYQAAFQSKFGFSGDNGVAGVAAGGASIVTGGFTNALTGGYQVIPSGGSVTYSGDGHGVQKFADCMDVYFYGSPAGSAQIQTALNGGSYITQAVITSSGSAGLSVTNIVLTGGFQTVKIVGTSGTVNIAQIVLRDHIAKGATFVNLSMSGIDWGQFTLCPSNVLWNYGSLMQPRLLIVEETSSADAWLTAPYVLTNILNGAGGNCSVLVVSPNPMVSDAANLSQIAVMRNLCQSNGWVFYDQHQLYQNMGGTNWMGQVDSAFLTDSNNYVHPPAPARKWAVNQTFLDTGLGITLDRNLEYNPLVQYTYYGGDPAPGFVNKAYGRNMVFPLTGPNYTNGGVFEILFQDYAANIMGGLYADSSGYALLNKGGGSVWTCDWSGNTSGSGSSSSTNGTTLWLHPGGNVGPLSMTSYDYQQMLSWDRFMNMSAGRLDNSDWQIGVTNAGYVNGLRDGIVFGSKNITLYGASGTHLMDMDITNGNTIFLGRLTGDGSGLTGIGGTGGITNHNVALVTLDGGLNVTNLTVWNNATFNTTNPYTQLGNIVVTNWAWFLGPLTNWVGFYGNAVGLTNFNLATATGMLPQASVPLSVVTNGGAGSPSGPWSLQIDDFGISSWTRTLFSNWTMYAGASITGGSYSNANYSGNGSGLTNLNATNLTGTASVNTIGNAAGATNVYGLKFTSPTNTPANGQVISATGTGGDTAWSGVAYSTNAFAGPTNTMTLANGYQRYVCTSGSGVGITNFGGVNASQLTYGVLFIRNDTGSNLTLSVTAAVTGSGDGARSWTMTNATTTVVSANCYGTVGTNVIVRSLW